MHWQLNAISTGMQCHYVTQLCAYLSRWYCGVGGRMWAGGGRLAGWIPKIWVEVVRAQWFGFLLSQLAPQDLQLTFGLVPQLLKQTAIETNSTNQKYRNVNKFNQSKTISMLINFWRKHDVTFECFGCKSVGRSVGRSRSVGPSVRRSVGPSVSYRSPWLLC